jgi:ZF-HD class homeobox domain-containing protein
MEYKRSSHVGEVEEEEEEEDDLDEEEEEDEEEENRGHHHYTTAPAAPVGAHPQQHQVAHGGQAHRGLVGSSHSSAVESAAAFSRPLLPPNSSLVSQLPPGFLQPQQQQAHPRRPAQHQQLRRQHEPTRNNGGTTPPPASTIVLAAAAAGAQCRYRECQRNHAARLGAHVLDGCCEFMPSADEGPGALACAACGCHRSFHRREVVPGAVSPSLATTPTANSSGRVIPLLLAPPHMQTPTRPHVVPPAAASAPAALTESSSEELHGPATAARTHHHQVAVGSASAPPAAAGKKRFRTKFTAEQKDRMREFAHRVGWRIHKPDSEAVDAFCAQVGVSRRVLKVWMHNNKHLAKTSPNESPSSQQPAQPHQHHDHHHYPPPPQQQQQQHNA